MKKYVLKRVGVNKYLAGYLQPGFTPFDTDKATQAIHFTRIEAWKECIALAAFRYRIYKPVRT